MSACVRRPSRGLKGVAAERALERWLIANGWTVHRAAKAGTAQRGGRWFCKSNDIFGALDILAIRTAASVADRVEAGLPHEPRMAPETWAIQVTTQNGRSERRRKLEAIGWPRSWRVSLMSHETVPDPANRVRRLHSWKGEDLYRTQDGAVTWLTPWVTWFNPQAIDKSKEGDDGTPGASDAGQEAPTVPGNDLRG